MKLRSVRGTHDIFGEEIDKFNFISNIVSKNANLKEYKEIQKIHNIKRNPDNPEKSRKIRRKFPKKS